MISVELFIISDAQMVLGLIRNPTHLAMSSYASIICFNAINMLNINYNYHKIHYIIHYIPCMVCILHVIISLGFNGSSSKCFIAIYICFLDSLNYALHICSDICICIPHNCLFFHLCNLINL